MKEFDLSKEEWREYEFLCDDECTITYRIEKPRKLFWEAGRTTHRVVDAEDIVHDVPTPGRYGCVLRWKNSDPTTPVNF
jgi:hypothetical protein